MRTGQGLVYSLFTKLIKLAPHEVTLRKLHVAAARLQNARRLGIQIFLVRRHLLVTFATSRSRGRRTEANGDNFPFLRAKFRIWTLDLKLFP